jgi:hypothetical protein
LTLTTEEMEGQGEGPLELEIWRTWHWTGSALHDDADFLPSVPDGQEVDTPPAEEG